MNLKWIDELKRSPGRFVNLGDGSMVDDGVYVMLGIVVQNSVDEYLFGHCRNVDVVVDYATGEMNVRDDGRGIPHPAMERVFDLETELGGMYDGEEWYPEKNRIGVRGVNALSSYFEATSFRDGVAKKMRYEDGKLVAKTVGRHDGASGQLVCWRPNEKLLPPYILRREQITDFLSEFVRANPSMRFSLNGELLSSVR